MIDTATISDYNLALYVDEYVKRAIAAAHNVDEDAREEYVNISITATSSSISGVYEITHTARTGWTKTVDVSGNNAIAGARKAMQRYVDDKREHQPTKVTPMLAAPIADSNISDAEFFAVVEDTSNDVPL